MIARALAWFLANGEPEPNTATSIELVWSAPPSCPDESALQRELARYRLGSETRDARAEVTVTESEGSGPWTVKLHIELSDDRIERRFDATDCKLAISAAALMIAVALDPIGALDFVEDFEEEPEPAPKPVTTVDPVPQAEPNPDISSRTGLIATLAAQGSLGPLPSFTGELFGGLGLRLGPSSAQSKVAGRLEVTGALALPRDAPSSARSDAGVRMSLGYAGLRGCLEPTLARLRIAFPLCLGAEVGVITGRGFGLDMNRTVRAGWFGIPADVGLSFSPGRFVGFVLAVGGFLSGTRPGFFVEGEGLVQRVPAGGFRVRLGLEFRWPDNLGGRRPRKG